MDINDFRAWFTVVMLAIFIGIVLWAWSGKRRKRFSEAANLPFNEPEFPRVDDDANKETGHE
ncbi:MAG TPA: cbb3-type cytochrome c oxidase subunit 3 [Gammaproteobacteria bacterium]|nr:cbb3-type cytochrome c oxidase subunit 3 [Gammaproteobacteria bacterium]